MSRRRLPLLATSERFSAAHPHQNYHQIEPTCTTTTYNKEFTGIPSYNPVAPAPTSASAKSSETTDTRHFHRSKSTRINKTNSRGLHVIISSRRNIERSHPPTTPAHQHAGTHDLQLKKSSSDKTTKIAPKGSQSQNYLTAQQRNAMNA